MTLSDALKFLHLDSGANDALVDTLLAAVPDYIELTTGMSKEEQPNEPLCEVVTKFLLTAWFFGDKADTIKLDHAITNLLGAISLKCSNGVLSL